MGQREKIRSKRVRRCGHGEMRDPVNASCVGLGLLRQTEIDKTDGIKQTNKTMDKRYEPTKLLERVVRVQAPCQSAGLGRDVAPAPNIDEEKDEKRRVCEWDLIGRDMTGWLNCL